jgi:hypothetical protein
MSSENKSESINIYLRNEEQKSTIMNDLSAERKYIILQNDTLQAENREYSKKIKELENEIEELEIDSGKMEKSMTYIKGMLKNFVEVDRLYKKIEVEQTELQSKINKNNASKKYTYFTEMIKYNLISIIFFMICFYFDTYFTFFAFTFDKLLFVYLFYEYNKRLNLNTTLTHSVIEDSRNKINDIHKAQDYISELIDNC